MIGIPLFADQHKNVFKLTSKELGMKIDFLDITPEKIINTVEEMIKNPV